MANKEENLTKINFMSESTFNTIEKKQDELYAIPVESILSVIYPVGAMYIGTTVTCPLQSLFGTWQLVASNITIAGGDIPVVGNGDAPHFNVDELGYGYLTGGKNVASYATNAASIVGITAVKYERPARLTTDSTTSASGMIAKASLQKLTANIWKRTA